MTTQSWTTNLDHRDDAGFRAWVADFIAKCVAVGLTHTADTGQIDTATVTLPASNAMGGFAIFRMAADALDATAPIFIRLDFGTGVIDTLPAIKIQIGPSTDGAGTITGTAKTTQRRCDASWNGVGGTGGGRNHWMCYVDGCFWFLQSLGAPGQPVNFNWAKVERTADADGVPSAEGALQTSLIGAYPGDQSVRFAAPAAAYLRHGQDVNGACYSGLVRQTEPGTEYGGKPQVQPLFGYAPGLFPLWAAGIVKNSEVPEATTFTWTPYGLAVHTYINIGAQGGRPWVCSNGASALDYGMAVVWE